MKEGRRRKEGNLDNVYCVGIMTIATENVIENVNESEKRLEEHQLREKENLNVNVNETENVIVATKEPIHRIVPDTDDVIPPFQVQRVECKMERLFPPMLSFFFGCRNKPTNTRIPDCTRISQS